MTLLFSLIEDWSGGLNEVATPVELAPNETPSANNAEIRGYGSGVAPRKGVAKLDQGGTSFPVLSSATQFTNMFFWVQDDVVSGSIVGRLICSVEGDIFSVDNVGVRAQLFDGTVGTTWDFQTAKNSAGTNRLWAVNGTDNNKKIDVLFAVSDWTINNGTAHKPTSICYWKGRMAAAGGTVPNSRIIFSAIGDPETWAANDFLDLRGINDPADPIIDMRVLGEDLIVFRRNSIWRVYDSTNFNNLKIHDVGIARLNQVAEWEGELYFASRSGLYSTNGQNLALHSHNLLISRLKSDSSSLAITREGKLYWVVNNGTSESSFYILDLSMESRPWMKHSVGANNDPRGGGVDTRFRPTAIAVVWGFSNFGDKVYLGGWYSAPTPTWAIAEHFTNRTQDWNFRADTDLTMEAFYQLSSMRLGEENVSRAGRITKINSLLRDWGLGSGQGVTIEVENELGDSETHTSKVDSVTSSVAVLKTNFAIKIKEFFITLSWNPSNDENEVISEVNQLEVRYRK